MVRAMVRVMERRSAVEMEERGSGERGYNIIIRDGENRGYNIMDRGGLRDNPYNYDLRDQKTRGRRHPDEAYIDDDLPNPWTATPRGDTDPPGTMDPWSPTAHTFAQHQFSHVVNFWKQSCQASFRLEALPGGQAVLNLTFQLPDASEVIPPP